MRAASENRTVAPDWLLTSWVGGPTYLRRFGSPSSASWTRVTAPQLAFLRPWEGALEVSECVPFDSIAMNIRAAPGCVATAAFKVGLSSPAATSVVLFF